MNDLDTIINYLETMFAQLPKTNEISAIKQEILSNMEEKYEALIKSGKSEHEAIGIVIDEFGHIDDLLEELGGDTRLEIEDRVSPELTDEEIESFLLVKKRSGKFIGLGVALIILGAASLVLIASFTHEIFGLIPLFIFVAIAIGLFIMTDHKLETYNYLNEGFNLSKAQSVTIKKQRQNFQPRRMRLTILGVILCVLAPLVLIIISELLINDVIGVSLLLIMVSFAVYLFISISHIEEGYVQLLQLKEIKVKDKKKDKIIDAISAIIWPLAIIFFLISGFIYNQWHINWIVFPITGLLISVCYGLSCFIKKEE